MDLRILIAVVFGLVLLAFGGFYFALGPHSTELPLPPAPRSWMRCGPMPAAAGSYSAFATASRFSASQGFFPVC